MVPPDAFSTAAPQSSSAFCKGCDAGTQCDSFSSKVFSCASAGDIAAANNTASNAFLIDISPWVDFADYRALCRYCYRITSPLQAECGCGIQRETVEGARLADKSRDHRRGAGGVAGRGGAGNLRY